MGSLFSGYGGLDLAVSKFFGAETVWYSEIEPAACEILAAHYPGVSNLGDVTVVDWAGVPPVDILIGGYPCQPFSQAGMRKGKNDERHLWPFVGAAIGALRPGVVVLENVRGHVSLGLADVIGDLAGMGYDSKWGVVRASDAGAPHGRATVFIVAYPHASGLQGYDGERGEASSVGRGHFELGASFPADSHGGRRGENVKQPRDIGQAENERQSCKPDGHYPDRYVARGVSVTDPAVFGRSRAGDARAGGNGLENDGGPSSTDSGSKRYGGGEDPRMVGRLGEETPEDGEGQGPSNKSREEPRTGSRALAADTQSAERGSAESEYLGTAIGPTAESRERTSAVTDWGKYEPAIRRWEHATRPSPLPPSEGPTEDPDCLPLSWNG